MKFLSALFLIIPLFSFASTKQLHDILVDEQEIACLSFSIFKEASVDSKQGQQLVAFVVLERALETSKSVCATVASPKQFSFVRGGLNGLKRDANVYMQKQHSFEMKKLAIEVVLTRMVVEDKQTRVTHFHTKEIRPKWANKMKRVGVSKRHYFYRSGGL